MRRALAVLVLFLAPLFLATPPSTSAGVAPLPAAPPAPWQPSPAKYGVVRVDDVQITMSDGVQLQADVYYPADLVTGLPTVGRFPVILAQTPYRKRSSTTVGNSEYGGDGYFPYLVQRGYINLIVDVRGTGSSGGQWDPFNARELQDGVELINWASTRLSGSNGVVGMGGFSYLGINQILVGAKVGKSSPLKAIFPVIPSHDSYRDLISPGGMWASGFMPAWFGLRAVSDLSPDDALASNPLHAVTEGINRSSSAQYMAAWAAEMTAGGARAYDMAEYHSRYPRENLAAVVANGIPAFFVGGWFDLFQRGNLLNYSALQNAWAGRPVHGPMKPGQKVTGRYQMVVGPWYHLSSGDDTLLDDINMQMLRWYDRWLKGVPNGVENTSKPLHLYELRSHRWVDTDVFPFAPTVSRHYLGRDGALVDAAPDAGTETMVWEPTAGACTRSMSQGNAGLYEGSQGTGPDNPCTQDTTAAESGRLTFTSAPLAAREVLAGPLTATIAATSTAPEVELAVTVSVISGADGTSYPVSTGHLIGSHRALDESRSWRDANGRWIIPFHPFTKAAETPVVPGEVTEYVIEIPSTFAMLDAGDQLRITVAPADGPRATPTAPQLAGLTGGVYEILLGGARPSTVDLSLLDPALFATSPSSWGPAE